jgi:hypothetical protein
VIPPGGWKISNRYLAHHILMKNVFIIGVLAVMVFLAGCGKRSGSPSGSTSPSTTTIDGSSSSLESALTAWDQGDNEEALSSFLKADWNTRPSSTIGPILSLSQKQYESLSDAGRRTKSIEVTARLQSLRLLATAVEQVGSDAAAKGDMTQARRCFSSLKKCGLALEDPDYMQIVQWTSRSMQKTAGQEMAKLGE